MYNNVEITHGSGTAVATDEVGGAHHQRMKLSVGAEGVASDLAPATSTAMTGANQLINNGAITYRGFTIKETSGVSPVTVRIFDNTTNTGTLLETIQLNPSESARENYDVGRKAATGIYLEKTGAGTFEGTVFKG